MLLQNYFTNCEHRDVKSDLLGWQMGRLFMKLPLWNVWIFHLYVNASCQLNMYIEKQAFTKGHLISEQICEDIDFPKLQRKYNC